MKDLKEFKRRVVRAAEAAVDDIKSLRGPVKSISYPELKHTMIDIVCVTPCADYHCREIDKDLAPLWDLDDINTETQAVRSTQKRLGAIVEMSNGDKLRLGATINVAKDGLACEYFIASLDDGEMVRLLHSRTIRQAVEEGYLKAKKKNILATVKWALKKL